MVRDIVLPPDDFKPSFLSCEKDFETVLRKLFVTSKPYSDELKRLLVINTKDCLDNKESEVYKKKIDEMSLAKMVEEGYIKTAPKLEYPEHEEVKSYIYMSFDDFLRTSNDEFRECTITFDIFCHTDYWDLGNFRLRPLKIAGHIDGILNKARLSGIGQLEFVYCKELLYDEVISGYSLVYRAVHGSDDIIPKEKDD